MRCFTEADNLSVFFQACVMLDSVSDPLETFPSVIPQRKLFGWRLIRPAPHAVEGVIDRVAQFLRRHLRAEGFAQASEPVAIDADFDSPKVTVASFFPVVIQKKICSYAEAAESIRLALMVFVCS